MDRITIVSKRYCDVEACFEFIDSFFTGEGINLYLKKMTGKDIGIIQSYIGKVLFSRYERERFFMYALVKQEKFKIEEDIAFRNLYKNQKYYELLDSLINLEISAFDIKFPSYVVVPNILRDVLKYNVWQLTQKTIDKFNNRDIVLEKKEEQYELSLIMVGDALIHDDIYCRGMRGILKEKPLYHVF
mgnify:CR=1 FL=1